MILKYPVNYITITGYYESGKHYALDLGWSNTYGPNQPIYAAADGEVIEVRKDYKETDTTGSSYGNYIKIRHNDSISTLYAHMAYQSVTLNVGDYVKQGDQIGLMGATGHALGNHLHYEVIINGYKDNPVLYTYVFPGQIVSSNPENTKGLLYYKEPEEDIETLRKMIEELEIKNQELTKEIERLKKELEEKDNFIFTYNVLKTSEYQIKLYEGETLFIKS